MSRTGNKQYRRNRQAIQHETTCWLCGLEIDTTLTYPHPYSWSADHITPVSQGGNNNGPLAPAHLRCNQQRGNAQPKTNTTTTQYPNTRNW